MLDYSLFRKDLSSLYPATPFKSLKSSFSPNSQTFSYQQQYQTPFQNSYQNSIFSNQIMGQQQISCIILPNGKKGGLFLGNINSAINYKVLQQYGIEAIVTAINDYGFRCNKNIEHLTLPIDDFAWFNIIKYFNEGTKFIHDNLQKCNVLVHCYAGISRSSTLVIAYLMRYCGMNLNQAYSLVKMQRPQICPNPGFLEQLKEYEFLLFQAFQRRYKKENEQSVGSIFKSFLYN